jgi:hypothetical protein
MTTATVQRETYFCPMCQTHKSAKEFYGSHPERKSINCKECEGKRQEERKLAKREEIIESAVSRILKRMAKGDGVASKTPWGQRVITLLGQQQDVDQLVADCLRGLLQDPANWRARIEGVKAYERLQQSVDATKDGLQDNLAKLNDDELAQLGMALVMRALAAEGNYELLRTLASQCGFRLVALDTIDSNATYPDDEPAPAAEAPVHG